MESHYKSMKGTTKINKMNKSKRWTSSVLTKVINEIKQLT